MFEHNVVMGLGLVSAISVAECFQFLDTVLVDYVDF